MFELTNEMKKIQGHYAYRIKATEDFEDVKSGDLGGFVSTKDNLDGGWVYDDAACLGNARCSGAIRNNAIVMDRAIVSGEVSENAIVYGLAVIEGLVKGTSKVFGHIIVKGSIDGDLSVRGARTIEGDEKGEGVRGDPVEKPKEKGRRRGRQA